MIMVVPVATAVTSPVDVTVAMPVFFDDHATGYPARITLPALRTSAE
jgi:hypothetical protein